jgi:hypothetical protein
VRDRHDPGARPDQSLQPAADQGAAIVDRRDAQPGAALLADDLPRHDVRVVLHRGDDDLVASSARVGRTNA